ncbi:MAG: hypothetical protein ACRD0V_11740 [Acidimicrobiales bacterium]
MSAPQGVPPLGIGVNVDAETVTTVTVTELGEGSVALRIGDDRQAVQLFGRPRFLGPDGKVLRRRSATRTIYPPTFAVTSYGEDNQIDDSATEFREASF